MKVQKSKDNYNSFAYLIGLFFLVSSAVFGVFVVFEDHLKIRNEAEGQSEFSSVKKITDLDNVNDHLRDVSDKMEYERLKTLLANIKASRDNSPKLKIVDQTDPNQPVIELENGMREQQLAHELGRTNEFKKPETDPRSVVYQSVIEDRQNTKAKDEERRRLAKEFVAKARKEGWIVNLDADFKIKSYRHVEDAPTNDHETDYRGYSVVPK